MADVIKGLFGGLGGFGASSSSVVGGGAADDFADYATAASPEPVSYATPSFLGAAPTAVPYTAWYRVWERTSLSDFKAEGVLIPIAVLIFLQLAWGRSTNRRKARNWVAAHMPILESEFASVGLGGTTTSTSKGGPTDPSSLLKEKTATEFVTYATGRQNVAFLDVKINLYRRFNPLIWLLETLASMMFAIVKPPKENVEVVVYTFDGQEKNLVPASVTAAAAATAAEEGQTVPKIAPSAYDGFVWAIVHKDSMKEFRGDRFDVSLTDVKDNAKLPKWATVMSESAEITDTLLTPDLVKAVEKAGSDIFEHLLITDMPADKPSTLEELEPRKRLSLTMKLPSGNSVDAFSNTTDVFKHFVRLPDELAAKGHFRAEVQRKLKKTREEEAARVRRAGEEERAEERKLEADKRKKQEREDLLRTMSPADQRKYLDKEREKQSRKTMRRVRA